MFDGNEELTESQLKFSYWFVIHKESLKKVGIWILVIFDIVTVGYGIFGFVDYFLISWNRDLRLRINMVRPYLAHEVTASLAPQSISAPSVEIFSTDNNRYDFVAHLENLNPDWYAVFRYQFATTAGTTSEAEGFILPAEDKYIGQFGQELEGVADQAELRFTKINWRRVNRHVIRDYTAWRDERLNFIITNLVHNSALRIDGVIGRTSFDVENRSAFAFWRAGFFIGLARGAGLGGANYVTLDNLDSGEKRHVDVNWFETLPITSGVEVRPDVNLFDPLVYMPARVR